MGCRSGRVHGQANLVNGLAQLFHRRGYAYDLADFATGDLSFQSDSELLRGASAQAKWTRNFSDGTAHSVRSWITFSDLDAPYAAFGMSNSKPGAGSAGATPIL